MPNKAITDKWNQQANDRHRQKLASIKSAIDNKPPKEYIHLEIVSDFYIRLAIE
jgi:hypothetical protein